MVNSQTFEVIMFIDISKIRSFKTIHQLLNSKPYSLNLPQRFYNCFRLQQTLIILIFRIAVKRYPAAGEKRKILL
jgi:hypothetical protein